MTRHGKNATASSVYSYQERVKDAKQSGYGTLHERLGADSIKEFDCCSLTLQPCRDPVISPAGFVFDKEAVLEYIVQQKKENERKMKEWRKQCEREREEENKMKEREHEKKVAKFAALEGTPAHPGVRPDLSQYDTPVGTSAWWAKPPAKDGGATPGGQKRAAPSNDDEPETTPIATSSGDPTADVDDGPSASKRAKQVPSFWIPSVRNETVAASKLEKPSQKILCPMSGKPLKFNELMPVIFTPIQDGDNGGKWISKKVRYMCPVTHDALTNTTRCAGKVVTMACVEKIIRKDMIDPTNGKALTEADIIELQRGGTGFAATNEVKAKLIRPQLELQ